MNFELTDEQKMIQDMARKFAEREIKPVAAELDRTHAHPKEICEKMGELGLMGVTIPEEYGGAGMDYICYAISLDRNLQGLWFLRRDHERLQQSL